MLWVKNQAMGSFNTLLDIRKRWTIDCKTAQKTCSSYDDNIDKAFMYQAQSRMVEMNICDNIMEWNPDHEEAPIDKGNKLYLFFLYKNKHRK